MAPDRRKSGTDHKKHTDSSARPETGQEEKIFQTCLTGKDQEENYMKKLRILGIVVFVIAAVSFGYFKYEQINSKDNQAPVITMDADSVEVSCQAGDEELLKGITAADSKDGDVTGSLIVESISNFMENHTRNMTVVAFDSDNHATKATRKIAYTDYTAPTFSLTEPLRFAMNTQDIMGTLTCSDVLDGDITGKIKMSSEYYVQADVAGEYPMVYQVANSAGDVQKLPVTVEIYDPSKEAQKPQFELSEYLVYTTVGNAVDPWSYVQQITMGGIKFVRGEDGVLRDPNPAEKQERTAITADEVQITNQADFNTPGTYEILYQITDDSGKESVTGQVRLIVVVR